MQSHIRKVHACLAVTCHLHFWQFDRDLLRATVVTRGWNGHRNKSQHRKSTLVRPKASFFFSFFPHPFTAMFATPSLGKRLIKMPNLKPSMGFLASFAIKTHCIERRFVIGPSNILFAGVYVCTFKPGNFTGWGSEGVKVLFLPTPPKKIMSGSWNLPVPV